jgi:hemerythrin-like domain-containing protein
MNVSEDTRLGADTIDSEDVVELILADHRAFEALLRALRNRDEDRPARLADLADLLVAHAVAEEREVYPSLERTAPEEADDIAHGAEEHAEGHEALQALQQVDPYDDEAFEEALEELSEALTHHLDEEERDVLNAARETVSDGQRAELGRAFRRSRGEQLADSPGDPTNVERLVREAQDHGLLDD